MSLALLFLAMPIPAVPISPSQLTVGRGGTFEIPLKGSQPSGPSSPWGKEDRDADHAAIAMNDAGDVVVAYHTVRDDFSPTLRQVEIAYFEYSTANDDWTLIDRSLVGDVHYSPLAYSQLTVKCERPDVVAVGNKFFVVWTRRYDRSVAQPTQEEEPAVLECAWVELTGNGVEVYDGTPSIGDGFGLDFDYAIRECAGTPDAVVLKQAPLADPTVGIVYPRQIDFGDLGPNPDNTRLFELALVTCSLDSNNQPSGSQSVTLLRSQLPYDGPTGNAAGLVLPDLAPSSEENAFWLTYEAQEVVPPNVVGAIRLEYWALNGTWSMEFGRNFKTINPMVDIIRRRPMVASLPGSGSPEMVSIAFNKTKPGSDSDVIYEQWQYDPSGPLFSKAPVPLNHQFIPEAYNEGKPSPLHGPQSPFFRRCYFRADGAGGPGDPLDDGIAYYDLNTDGFVQVHTSDTAARPAVAFGEVNGQNTVALTWEEVLFPSSTGPDKKRIVIMFE